MGEPEFRTSFGAGWVGDGASVPLPETSRLMMAGEDVKARRDGELERARTDDRAEAMALQARTWGTVRHGLSDVFAHAQRQMRADDYHAEQEELRRSATGWTEDDAYDRQLTYDQWTDDRLAAEASGARVRQLGRAVDQDRLAERVASDKLIGQARERHPQPSGWPAWVRPS